MPDFSALRAYAQTQLPDLRTLNNDTRRAATLALDVGALHVDLGKQRLDERLLAEGEAVAERQHLRHSIENLFTGGEVNPTEQRPALHTLLRADDTDVPAALRAHHAEVVATGERMARIVNALREGQAAQLGLVEARDIVNIGIGGSDLGPRLVVDALARPEPGRPRVHFVSNVDAHSLLRLLPQLDPRHTLFILASKSFTTQETLLNGELARRWLRDNGITHTSAHFLAVSANVPAATAFGLQASQVLPMWDWVGGRYSVWSAVGIAAALALGMPAFEAFKGGAAEMDRHFRHAPWTRNLPFLSAWAGILNRNVFDHTALAVVPYDDRLRLLPNYLQQLEMESLGKSVRSDGDAVHSATVPVLLPGVGTDAQHAFFQALHQGTEVVPVDFIGVMRPDHGEQEQHRALLANLLAQSASLLRGRDHGQALDGLPAHIAGDERELQARHRVFPGNRPSTTILLERLAPRALGNLLALYEHKVYVQSRLWGINAFDQWGVELGKQIARSLLPALASGGELEPGFDASTQALVRRLRN